MSGAVALLMFAASARAETSVSPLASQVGVQAEAGSGSGSGETTTTTIAGTGSGSGISTTTTTVVGATTTTVLGAATTSSTTPTCAASPVIGVSLQSVRPGGSTNVSGSCFPRNVAVALVLNSDPVLLGTVGSDSAGNFGATVVIPSNVPSGSHVLTATGGGQSASITLLVSSSATVAGLGVTGMSWNLAILGLALLAAGIIVLSGERIGKQELIEFV